jgi:LmbE family N-acetylglucosaminyl deacetylase
VRENELRCAVEALGTNSLTFLNYVDPTVGPDDTLFAFTEDVDELVAQITEAIHFWKAGAVLSHGINGEYGHPAHKLAYEAANLAVQTLGEQAPLFYSVAAAFPENPRPRLANVDSPADIVVNVTPFIPQKTAAAMCHKTQHDLFIRHTAEEVGHPVTVPEVILPVESLHRVWPAAEEAGKIHDALADLLWDSGCAYLPADRPLE